MGFFRTLWKTTTPYEMIVLPISDSCDIIVDWGLTTNTSVQNVSASPCYINYTYPVPGTYIINITGIVTGLSFLGQNCLQLYSILEWGGFTVDATSQYVFTNCSHLSVDAIDQPIIEGSPSMDFFFANANLTTQPIHWDLTNVFSIDSMFANNSLFNARVNLVSPDLVAMRYLFQNCFSFDSPVSIDTSSVEYFDSFLAGASSFNSPLSFTTTANVISMDGMFSLAEKFNQAIVFDGTSLSTAANMFAGASSFNSSVILRNSYNLSITKGMFFFASSYNQPTSLIVKDGVNMNFMFANATSFDSVVTFNNATARSQVSMFENATAFNQPITFPLATNDRSYMFRGATSFMQRVVADAFNVTCTLFCPYCILPAQVSGDYCEPCAQKVVLTKTNDTMCNCPYGQAVLNSSTRICDAIVCPSPAYTSQNGICVCTPHITTGSATYSGNTVTGCVSLPPFSSNVTIPFSSSSNTTTVNASGVRVVIRPDSLWGDNGTLSVAVKPPSNATVSQIVSINFYDSSDHQKNISNLSNPVQFYIPLQPGAATPFQACLGEVSAAVVPACNWFDPIDSTWKTSGCQTNLSATEVECTCTHLTDFAAVLPKFNPIPINQTLALTSTNIALHPDGIITIAVVLAVFVLVTTMAVHRDKKEKRMEKELQAKKFDKWTKAAESQVQIAFKTRWWKRFKDGLQLRHTWGSLIFRKSGTTFRSVDRVVVSLFMLLVLMSMSASFHDRNKSFEGRAVVSVLNILVSLPPGLLLTHLFTHTGELGFHEKWQIQKGMMQPSRFKCLRYRFNERWRYVWYALTLVAVIGMIIYILSIALMFDQNPEYYCRGKTTLAWIIDFIIPYAISICVVEPVKIMLFLTSQKFLQDQRTKARLKPESAEHSDLDNGAVAEMQVFPETSSESS